MLTLAGKPLAVPILQGGMGVGVSLGGLAGAVAACGGMGCISTADTGYREPDFAKDPVGANRRALAAEKLGMAEVPCVCVDDLTPEQVEEFRVATRPVWDKFMNQFPKELVQMVLDTQK